MHGRGTFGDRFPGLATSLRENLDIVEGRGIVAVRPALNANLISPPQSYASNPAPRRGRSIDLSSRVTAIGSPIVHRLVRDPHLKMRRAARLIEMLNVQREPASGARVTPRSGALSCRARYRLAARSRFPWGDFPNRITCKIHRLGFDPIRIPPPPSFRVGNGACAQNPVTSRVPPHLCLASLIFELRQHLCESLVVDAALQLFPFARVARSGFSAPVM